MITIKKHSFLLVLPNILLTGGVAFAAGQTHHPEALAHSKTLLGYAAVNFVIFVALLTYLLRKPVVEFLAHRQKTIHLQMDEATAKRKKIEAQFQTAKSRKANLEQETQQIKASILAAAEKERQHRLHAAQALAQQYVNNAQQRALGLEREVEAEILTLVANELVANVQVQAKEKIDTAYNTKLTDHLVQNLVNQGSTFA